MSLIEFKKIIKKLYLYFYYYSKSSSEIIKKADEDWQNHSISPGDQSIQLIHKK